MARKLRIQYPGAMYHVMNRGDRREAIFEDDQDRQRFLSTLGEASRRDRAGFSEPAQRSSGQVATGPSTPCSNDPFGGVGGPALEHGQPGTFGLAAQRRYDQQAHAARWARPDPACDMTTSLTT